MLNSLGYQIRIIILLETGHGQVAEVMADSRRRLRFGVFPKEV